MERNIVMRPTREGLLELYHRRGTIDPFRSPATRPYRRMFIKVIIGSVLLILCSLIWEQLAWLLVLAWIFMIGAMAMIIYAFFPMLRHRASVHRWAKASAAIGESTMQLGGTGYHLKTDGSEIIVKWSAIERVELYDDHVIISANGQRLFPKSSMTAEEFTYFCDLLRTKVLEPPVIVEEGDTKDL